MSPFTLRLLLIGIVWIGGNVGKFWSVLLNYRQHNDLLPFSGLVCASEVITTVAQLSFKRCATAVLKSNLTRSIEFSTAVALCLKPASIYYLSGASN